MNAYTTLSLTVFTRNFVADFLQAKCNCWWNTSFFVFEPPFAGLGSTYDVHLRLIGMLVVDLLLVLIEFFSLGVMAWGTTKNIEWKRRFRSNGISLTRNFRQIGSLPTNHSSSHKTRVNVLSCGIRMLAHVSFLLSQSMHLTDRRTEGQAAFSNTIKSESRNVGWRHCTP